jgi:hypothetical protein
MDVENAPELRMRGVVDLDQGPPRIWVTLSTTVVLKVTRIVVTVRATRVGGAGAWGGR